jgi:hypothetical protein
MTAGVDEAVAPALAVDDHREPPGGASEGAGGTQRTLLLHLAVFGGFLLLGVLLWWRVWITGSPGSTITCQCGDPSQELWFLTWTPWALVHGHSPFLTNAIYAGQGGANMMVNTSWMLPATVLAPVTWLFGPVASFNLAATVAPAISAWCFFLAARRVTTLVPAQILGGLLFGFSPFVLQNDPFGHLNFTLLFFPPLAFILLHDLFVTHRRPPARTGALLAVLVVAEFFTSTELLAIGSLVIAIALVAAAGMAPRAAWAQRDRFLTAAAVAAGIVAVVLAYPVWFLLRGPRHIVGFPWSDSPQLGTTPSAIVDAGIRVHAGSIYDQVGGYFGGIGPNAGPLHLPSLVFFGWLLIGFVGVSAITWYRWRLAWTLVVGTVAAWLFSFGTTLGTEGAPAAAQAHPWWLPWRLVSHLPLIADILPIRFGVMVTFGGAMLLAISLDRWRTIITAALTRRRPSGGTGRYRRPGVVAGALMAVVGTVVLAPVALASSVPFAVVPSPVPAWFTVDTPSCPPAPSSWWFRSPVNGPWDGRPRPGSTSPWRGASRWSPTPTVAPPSCRHRPGRSPCSTGCRPIPCPSAPPRSPPPPPTRPPCGAPSSAGTWTSPWSPSRAPDRPTRPASSPPSTAGRRASGRGCGCGRGPRAPNPSRSRPTRCRRVPRP